jgi:hypothetical protein
LDGLLPARVGEGDRRLGPAIEFKRVGRGERDHEGAPPLLGLLRPAPEAVTFAMLRAHLDHVAAALASHIAKPRHADEIGPCMLTDMLDDPRRPRNVTAIRYLEIPDLLERIKLGQVERDCPIPDGAANREHLVRHHRCFFHRIAQGLDGDRLKAANGERAPNRHDPRSDAYALRSSIACLPRGA